MQIPVRRQATIPLMNPCTCVPCVNRPTVNKQYLIGYLERRELSVPMYSCCSEDINKCGAFTWMLRVSPRRNHKFTGRVFDRERNILDTLCGCRYAAGSLPRVRGDRQTNKRNKTYRQTDEYRRCIKLPPRGLNKLKLEPPDTHNTHSLTHSLLRLTS